MEFKAGNGQHIRFWEDGRSGDQYFCSRFPCLFILSGLYEAPMYCLYSEDTHSLVLYFRRSPHYQEIEELFFFFIGMLNSACLSTNEDSRVGKGDFSVVFSSKSFLICLSSPSRYPIFLPTFFGRPRFNGVGCDNEPTPLERHYGLLMDHHSGSYMNHYDGSQNPFLIVKCTLIFYLKMLIYFLYKKYTTEGNHKVRAFV